jgi:hypothetical protein
MQVAPADIILGSDAFTQQSSNVAKGQHGGAE